MGLDGPSTYEMMFYVAFSAVLFLRPRIAIPMLSVAMLVAWLMSCRAIRSACR